MAKLPEYFDADNIVDPLTEEQTKKTLLACMSNLQLVDVIEVLTEKYGPNDREEIVAALEDTL